MHLLAVIVEHVRERAGEGETGGLVVPAHGRAADLNIDHRHRELQQQRGIAVAVMHAGPVRRLGRDVILLKTKLDAVALEGEKEISHIARIRLSKAAGGHVAEGMHGQHIVRGVAALVPCDHTGHVGVGKVGVHLREKARIVEAEGDVRGSKIEFVSVPLTLHDVLPGKLEPGLLFKEALLFEQIPDAEGYVAPIVVVVHKIDSFQWSLSYSVYSRR